MRGKGNDRGKSSERARCRPYRLEENNKRQRRRKRSTYPQSDSSKKEKLSVERKRETDIGSPTKDPDSIYG